MVSALAVPRLSQGPLPCAGLSPASTPTGHQSRIANKKPGKCWQFSSQINKELPETRKKEVNTPMFRERGNTILSCSIPFIVRTSCFTDPFSTNPRVWSSPGPRSCRRHFSLSLFPWNIGSQGQGPRGPQSDSEMAPQSSHPGSHFSANSSYGKSGWSVQPVKWGRGDGRDFGGWVTERTVASAFLSTCSREPATHLCRKESPMWGGGPQPSASTHRP